MTDPAGRILGLYHDHAAEFARLRGRQLQEAAWLDAFFALQPASPGILDLGCGNGEPLARAMAARGARLTGVDGAAAMIERARAALPDQHWICADMRGLALGRRFTGILAWNSFFHLPEADQPAMFATFARHAEPGAALMFTSGTDRGIAMGEFGGEPLFHASLDTADYTRLLTANGFAVVAHRVADPDCGGLTIWLARYAA